MKVERLEGEMLYPKISTEQILVEAQARDALYEVKYVDSDNWTVPVKLNPDRIERILNDNSIKQIRIEFKL
jgi:hypothetical protein